MNPFKAASRFESKQSPLSLDEYRRLTWLRGRVAADMWLDSKGLLDHTQADAARLSFLNWLVISGRVHEWVRP